MRSGVPAGDLRGVVDVLLEAVGAEGSEANGCRTVHGAHPPVGSRGGAAHIVDSFALRSGCCQLWRGFVVVAGHSSSCGDDGDGVEAVGGEPSGAYKYLSSVNARRRAPCA